MDNPTNFTPVWRADSLGWDFTDAGLFGSVRAASDAAGKILANTDVPGLVVAVASITMLERDPFTGTPLEHLAPPNAAGYALASLSGSDPAHRGIDHTIYEDLGTARSTAEAGRSRNRATGNDTVLDVVAVTVIKASAP